VRTNSGFSLQANGYPFLEVVSALQKEIRRGNEKDAMYWAMCLVPRQEAYLWRRLLVIVNEDIGIANPTLLSIIPSLRAQFFEFREQGKDGAARLILANAILLMSRSPKCRMADEFQRVCSQRFVTGRRPEIPDYALDNHTYRGRQMGRGVDHWLVEGCRLEPLAEGLSDYKDEAEDMWRRGQKDAPKWGKRGARARDDDDDGLEMEQPALI
jgi:replication-associated recombination protein RarA